MLQSSQQFFQQIPVLTGANLLAMLVETNRFPAHDPLAEIRNGESAIELVVSLNDSFACSARLKVAPVWRRFLAETVDFILLHTIK